MPYDYTRPMLIFVACGVLAMLLGLWLKAEEPQKEIRAGTAQYQEVAQATPE